MAYAGEVFEVSVQEAAVRDIGDFQHLREEEVAVAHRPCSPEIHSGGFQRPWVAARRREHDLACQYQLIVGAGISCVRRGPDFCTADILGNVD